MKILIYISTVVLLYSCISGRSYNRPSKLVKLNKPIGKATKIKIENEVLVASESPKVFGIYDPAENNFDLNMWSTTKVDDLKSSLRRIKKLRLSKTSNQILEKILLSYAYPPQGMKDKEFVELKGVSFAITKYKGKYIGITKK